MAGRTADVVVIGGGVTGASTAMHLARRGAGKVVLVEKGQLGSGASGRSAAMIREHYLDPPLVRMAREASRVFHNFAEEIGGDAGFVETGRVLLFGEVDRRAVEANVAMNRELGVEISIITPDQAQQMLPQSDMEGVAIGIWEPQAGHADPVATTLAFADEARRQGAEILTHTPVTGLRVERGRLTGVSTLDGVIETGVALNAAGAWGNLVGSGPGGTLPLRPTRVQVIQLRRPPALETLRTSVIDHVTGAWLREDVGGYTLVGGEAPEDVEETVNPNHFGLSADQDVITRFWHRAAMRFPAFKGATCRGGYGAIYDLTPDGNPILDRSPTVEGLYLAVGFSGHGFKLSPVVGHMMAEFIMEGRAHDHDISLFRLGRFEEGDPLLPEHPYADRPHH